MTLWSTRSQQTRAIHKMGKEMNKELSESKRCPLCGNHNGCQADTDPYNCWCLSVMVPQELLELVPEKLKDKACICLSCIERHNQQSKSIE
jgi:Cysteine-rich CWC